MKISIEFDTSQDDKCLITSVLDLIQNHSKCGCHEHRDEVVVKKDKPVVQQEVKKDKPKVAKKAPKEKPANPTCTCKVCGNTFVAKTRRAVDYCSPKCRYTLANFKRRHGGAEFIPASQVQTLQVVKNPIPLSKPIVQPAVHDEKKCPLCELSFSPVDPRQKFCMRCITSFGEEECQGLLQDKIAKEMAEKEKIRTKWRTCPKCARDFQADHDEMFCPRCTEALTKKKKRK